MNPFESGSRKVIPAVLVYARHGDGVLMIHRDGATPDYHAGRWNGLGGKLEADESPRAGACREFLEESGVELPEGAFRPVGTLQFPNFKAHKNEDWLVFVFTVDLDGDQSASIQGKCREGSLHWIPESDLLELNLWPGDRQFLPLVTRGTPFIGTIWYDGPKVKRSWIERL